MLKELRTQHRTIIQMVFSGYKNNEIAERLEMTPATVSTIVRSPLGQSYLAGLQDKAQEATLDVRKKLVSLNSNALDAIERMLNPREKAPHSVQLNAAKDVLDRTGYKAADRLSVDMTMNVKTDDELDAEINALQQSILPHQQAKLTESSDSTVEPIPNETFINEQSLTNKQMDSSGELVNSSSISEQDSLSNANKSPQKSLIDPPSAVSEESVSLVAKIPVDVFQSR